MKVRHHLVIVSTCPVDGQADTYLCDVFVRDRVLKCEDVICAVADVTAHGPIFQEDLTQQLADRL
jgi:hypothetical protein